MLKTFDIVMIGAMAAAATVTYQIKHLTDNKRQDVRRIEAEIKLEKDTIELLKADWALLAQPNRLERLIAVYGPELKLEPTMPTQLARPFELPMLRSQLPPAEPKDEIAKDTGPASDMATDDIATGSVNR
ncbi:hypothetical protein HGO38_00660 [Rhizobium sp. CG5]|uniref:cell division protein FtsL n=1 Tax=Rhizobium sp. CG5 TaxID=2726076 RepID=UPI00203486F5|nr:hypothetical protein [Rhizobium sp. CG5]MCM2471990.1 hypothetical protein [Rhizobium sp. CG5]